MFQLPAHLQNLQTPDIGIAALANLGSAMPPHVSIGNSRFTLIDAGNNEIAVPTFDPQSGPYLDACIVDVADVMSRIYFAGNYDPSADGTRPDCFSDNGVAPSISASSPQSPTCAACPKSEWTKVNANGKKVPWCSHKYKIALLIPGFDTMFLLSVPPNSHGPLREYIATCTGNSVKMNDLITRMWFVSQGTLGFKPKPGGPAEAFIDARTVQLRQSAYAEKKTDVLVGRTDVARSAGAIAGPAQTQQPTIAAMTMLPANSTSQQVAEAFAGIQQPSPQVQQPAQQTTQWPVQAQQPMQQPVQQVQQPSEPPPAQRRRRRTAAEMAEANGAPATGQAPQQPAAAPQAPFPHPGQVAQAPTGQVVGGPAAQGSFGMAAGQPAAANPELSTMLDDFFKS